MSLVFFGVMGIILGSVPDICYKLIPNASSQIINYVTF